MTEQLTLLADIPAAQAHRQQQRQVKRVLEKMQSLYSDLDRSLAQEAYYIHRPTDAAELVLYDMSLLEQEELRVILLNTRNRVIRIVSVYRGSLNSSQVRVGELFREAIRDNAAAIIVCHNHPSGDPTPSPDDVTVTRATVQAGKLLDIDVLDHVVIAGGRYISLKERGLAFDGGN